MQNAVRGLIGIVSIVMLTTGCGPVAPPVPVYGPPGDVERLVGKWFGEYVGDPGNDRRGTIVFELRAVQEHAHGDVVMTPQGTGGPYQRPQGEEWRRIPAELAPMSRVLTIRFVRTVNGMLEGVIDTYWDPDRQTEASSTFRGRLEGDKIEGTFTTTFRSGAAATTGRWSVTRQSQKPG